MDAETRQRRIRQLAHEIWEAEGRPDGHAARHWAMAERLVAAEAAAEADDEALPPPAPRRSAGNGSTSS
ncbi:MULTISPECIES: DUF2934 domain-containing protein [Xanthomonas]|uniref:DUF2934 domain-containing protein n=2 Tax=Xanthomonas TaxID=338 RepID=A0A2P5Z4P9_9XANT|nr:MULTISPECIES: DUF2934 domain-containing protein [Xanthomonas]MCC4593050.1 DUF2934 domain-containing protein [Xanthomonas campestris pv. cannae]MBO9829364.1 DUF2934 domain-containing protein [Xanthomonas sp. A2111]MBO9875183.1 DUF2934 domain-containing protein [Xanthomonas sp. D-93]MBO9883662.1 DUF2934 domain-containing protein [Xanthomonas sp. D-109]MDS9993875.1 DUF2934 domain-containing protein [Xanthomonas sp. A2111]